MELVNKNNFVLASESDLRKKDGFYCSEPCRLMVSLPKSSVTRQKKECFFFFDEKHNLIEKGDLLYLDPDEEVLLFRCQISLYDNGHIAGVDFSYRRISFEVDDETRTYFIVGSREFITTSQEITKKIRKVVKIS